MCQSEQVHACHHVCITSLIFLVPTAKANDAACAGESKISIGIAWSRKGDAWLDTTYTKHRLKR